jgi:hypothetical protein
LLLFLFHLQYLIICTLRVASSRGSTPDANPSSRKNSSQIADLSTYGALTNIFLPFDVGYSHWF